jgi:hypothetical protein
MSIDSLGEIVGVQIEINTGRPVERTIAVVIDDFTLGLLEDASTAGRTTQGVLLMQAIRYYLAERDSSRPGWPCSRLDEDGEAMEVTSIELDVDGVAWEAFLLEADRQKVSTDRLLRHGALYYLADRDSGRLTQKILENLEKQEL